LEKIVSKTEAMFYVKVYHRGTVTQRIIYKIGIKSMKESIRSTKEITHPTAKAAPLLLEGNVIMDTFQNI